MATPRSRIEASVRSGSGLPSDSYTSTPASWKSQSNSTPVASSTRRVASASSGPVPSPGIKVTRCDTAVLSVSGAGRHSNSRGNEVAAAHQHESEHAAHHGHHGGHDEDLVEPVDERPPGGLDQHLAHRRRSGVRHGLGAAGGD